MVERYSALNPGHLAQWADNSSTRKGRGNAVSKKRILVDARTKKRAGVPKIHKDKRPGSGQRDGAGVRARPTVGKRKS
jgi:hypothetical protein